MHDCIPVVVYLDSVWLLTRCSDSIKLPKFQFWIHVAIYETCMAIVLRGTTKSVKATALALEAVNHECMHAQLYLAFNIIMKPLV